MDYKEQINFYCDESCYLEHDNKSFMLLGALECPKNDVIDINKRIKDIKLRNNISEHSEVKWSKCSPKNINLYMDLINYFFDNPNLSFKTIIIEKNKLNHEKYNQTHDIFYYKMYYTLLKGAINPKCINKIFVDEKDTHNSERVKKLEECLHLHFSSYDFDKNKIAPIQIIKSHLVPLMQLVDILLGLMSYFLNVENKSETKKELINLVKTRSGYSLKTSTVPSEKKFNIFYFEGDSHAK